MNQDQFFSSLGRFDYIIGREADRNYLLPIDNCPAHGNTYNFSFLCNVGVEFLSTNTTSKIQPLDAGIIACVTNRYRGELLFRIIENVDWERKTIYNVDFLTAMQWTVWNGFKTDFF